MKQARPAKEIKAIKYLFFSKGYFFKCRDFDLLGFSLFCCFLLCSASHMTTSSSIYTGECLKSPIRHLHTETFFRNELMRLLLEKCTIYETSLPFCHLWLQDISHVISLSLVLHFLPLHDTSSFFPFLQQTLFHLSALFVKLLSRACATNTPAHHWSRCTFVLK